MDSITFYIFMINRIFIYMEFLLTIDLIRHQNLILELDPLS
jgi:hypothetical protein